MEAVTAPPLRRDTEGGMVAGVCAGISRRLGIDPIILRVVFAPPRWPAAPGLAAYALAWAFLPDEDETRPPIVRLAGRRQTWLVATGGGMLLLSMLLVLREWGLWFSDAIAWPVLLALAGGALIWRQSASAAPADVPPSRRRSARARTARRIRCARCGCRRPRSAPPPSAAR